MLKVVTFWDTLIGKARKLGQARLKGNKEEIINAEKELKAYEQLCLKADKMIIPNVSDKF